LAGKCVTGGRLNLRKALESGPPSLQVRVDAGAQIHISLIGLASHSYVLQASSNLFNWFPLQTNQASSNGLATFSDSPTSAGPMRFYRAFALP
jgi:hypothetical protein